MSTLKVDNIRHNNATTDALVLSNDGSVAIGTCTATTINTTNLVNATQLSHRNIIINGAMKVAQRGVSTTISTGNNTNASGVYTVDRMKLGCYVGSERYTLSQETDAPTGSGFTKSFKIKTSTADTSANAGTYAQFVYQIEGQDLQHLLKGTSSAKPLTFSFWVKGNTNYTPVAELKDNTNVRINVQTFNVTTSWTKVVLTYVGDTTGTIDDDNTAGLTFNIWLKAAAFYSGGTSPAQNTWVPQSNHNIRAALLTFDIATSTDNYFQITGLQLEVGDTATPFEHRSFGEELSRCQRYCYVIPYGANSVNTRFIDNIYGDVKNSSEIQALVTLPVPMRDTPSYTGSSTDIELFANNGSNYFTADGFSDYLTYGGENCQSMSLRKSGASSISVGQSGKFLWRATGGFMKFDAEFG